MLWQKLKLGPACDPVIPLLDIYQKEVKLGSQIHINTPMIIATLFTTAKMWKQLVYPLTGEWIKKM